MGIHCLESDVLGCTRSQEFPRPSRCPSGRGKSLGFWGCTLYNPIHPSSQHCTNTIHHDLKKCMAILRMAPSLIINPSLGMEQEINPYNFWTVNRHHCRHLNRATVIPTQHYFFFLFCETFCSSQPSPAAPAPRGSARTAASKQDTTLKQCMINIVQRNCGNGSPIALPRGAPCCPADPLGEKVAKPTS